MKILLVISLLLVLVGCASTPKRTTGENDIAIKRIMQRDGFQGVERYFHEYSYQDSRKDNRAVINLSSGEYSLDDLKLTYQKDSSRLSECSQSEEEEFLKTCIDEFKTSNALFSNEQLKEVRQLNSKYWKKARSKNYTQEKKSVSDNLSPEEHVKRSQEYLQKLQTNAKEYENRKCLAIGSATIMQKIGPSQYRIQYTLTEKTGRCARFGSSAMGGGCIQPEVIQSTVEDEVKFLKDPGFRDSSFVPLFRLGFKRVSSNLIFEDTRCQELLRKM